MQKNKKIPGRPVKKGGLSRSGIMLIVLSVALIAVVTALIILLNVRGGEESKPEETTPAVTTPAPEPTEEPTEEPQVSDVDFGSSDYSRASVLPQDRRPEFALRRASAHDGIDSLRCG